LPQAVYFKDKDARKLISNKVDYEIMEAKAEAEILGKTDMEIFPGDVGSIAYQQDLEILNTGTPLTNHEHAFTAKNGLEVWFLTTKIPLFNELNEIIGLLGIGMDITEQKLGEKKLIVLNSELEDNIKQLKISNTELEQFAYVASHDLQEPLRMVTSFLSQLEKKYGEVLDEKGKRYIYFAVDGAKRMRQLILDLLEFSRVGRTESDLEEVDFNSIVGEVIALLGRNIEELNAVIRFEKLPTILTYKIPVRQVFQNLIGNSLKYHKPNTTPLINIAFKETKTYIQISIKDNGIGINPNYFEKIFIIFQRLHNKDEYSGTGMGLAITKKIVENMGGKIWVESEEGKGVTMHFTILKNHKL
jgi:signal transduction histidine kinase